MSVVSISETDEDLAGRWSLVFEDFALLNAKPAATRLGFAAQLLLYSTTGRFGRGAGEFPDNGVTYLAEQIVESSPELYGYDWLGRVGIWPHEYGRASARERGCLSVCIAVGA